MTSTPIQRVFGVVCAVGVTLGVFGCNGPKAPGVDPNDLALVGIVQVTTGAVSGNPFNHVSASAFQVPDGFKVTKGADFVHIVGGTQPLVVTGVARPLVDPGSGSSISVPVPILAPRDPATVIPTGSVFAAYQVAGSPVWSIDVPLANGVGEAGNTLPTPAGGRLFVSSPGVTGGLGPFAPPTDGLSEIRPVTVTALPAAWEINPNQPLRFDTVADAPAPGKFFFKLEGLVDGKFNTVMFTVPADATGVTLPLDRLPSVVTEQSWNLTDAFPGELAFAPVVATATAAPAPRPEALVITRGLTKDARGVPFQIAAPLVVKRSAGGTPQPGAMFTVMPIEAVFKQPEFSTYYTVRISNPGKVKLTIEWKVEGNQSPSCYAITSKYLTGGADSEIAAHEMIWKHPHPPCDPTTQHAADTVKVVVSGASRKIGCQYQGAETGTGMTGSCAPVN